MVKHRAHAVGLIENGHVRLNRAQVLKPAHVVRPGDVLTIVVQEQIRVLRVRGAGMRRGPFAEACQLYEEINAPSSPSEIVRA